MISAMRYESHHVIGPTAGQWVTSAPDTATYRTETQKELFWSLLEQWRFATTLLAADFLLQETKRARGYLCGEWKLKAPFTAQNRSLKKVHLKFGWQTFTGRLPSVPMEVLLLLCNTQCVCCGLRPVWVTRARIAHKGACHYSVALSSAQWVSAFSNGKRKSLMLQ